MNSEDKRREEEERKFAEEIGRKERRRLRAKRRRGHAVWSELGMFGMVGWSVAVPTLLFTAFGIWLDVRQDGGISWTLTFLFIGIVLGSLNAWYWVKRERQSIDEEKEE